VAQEVEEEALNSNPSPTQKKKKKKPGRGINENDGGDEFNYDILYELL
jgi:hypothetical protein